MYTVTLALYRYVVLTLRCGDDDMARQIILESPHAKSHIQFCQISFAAKVNFNL